MDVTLAVLADYANLTQEGKLNIMGVFAELNPPVLPFHLPAMYLVIGFAASPSEAATSKEILIVLMASEGRELLRLQNRMIVPSPLRPGSRTYIQSIIGLNGILFEQPGEYQFAILVNGEEKETIPLRVNAPPNGG